MSTSFPYLSIARKFGVDYGDVIRVVESFDSCQLMTLPERESVRQLSEKKGLMDAIHEAMHAEGDRREHVQRGNS